MSVCASPVKKHMTLGQLLSVLDKNSKNLVAWTRPDRDDESYLVMSNKGVHSYKKYPDHIAVQFEEDGSKHLPAMESELYEQLTSFQAQGMMTGHKGGDYPVQAECPVWLSSREDVSGLAVTGIDRKDDIIILVCDIDRKQQQGERK